MVDGKDRDLPGGAAAGDAAPELVMSDLPPVVRDAVVAFASQALDGMSGADVPRQLAAVARFTPVKRARAGAAALARALDGDPAFRAAVAMAMPGLAAKPPEPPDSPEPQDSPDPQELQNSPEPPAGAHVPDPGDVAGLPDAASALPGSAPGPSALVPDPVADAARAFLLRLPDAAEKVARAGEISAQNSASAVLRARVAELTVQVEALTAELARVRDSASDTPGPAAAGTGGEAERLRARLRERGQRIREAELAVAAAREETARVEQRVLAAELAAERERTSAAQWRRKAEEADLRAERARAALDRVRGEISADRVAADRRVELLLDALQGTVAGLRAQWKVATGGPDPADLVAARLPTTPRDAHRVVDPGLLTDWLTLPGAHLIVDGYNVTKTGYGELPLADQRTRLTRSLSALAARTSAEVTVVFDGAAVVAPPPAARGVRVLFSPPGVIADRVVRDLVAAEPAGRVVVVVSSDKEVVDGVRRSGARTAPSAVLLALTGSGAG